MSSQLKLLKRIRKVRERMRDVAAAELATLEGERIRHENARNETERIRLEILAEATHSLAKARGIAALEKVGIEMCDAESYLLLAENRLKDSAESKHLAASRLRERERAVRLSDELLARRRQELRKSADKEEQAMVDDMIASRWSDKQ